jgi:hypothetical protein
LARELESFEHSQIILSSAQQRERRDRVARDFWVRDFWVRDFWVRDFWARDFWARNGWLRVCDAAGRARLAERLEEWATV